MRANGASRVVAIEQYRQTAQRRACWRRLFLVFGPSRCAGLAELLISDAKPDMPGGLSCTPRQAVACAILRISPRSCERQIAELVRTKWAKRVGPRACNGRAQKYQLTVPPHIPPELISRARSPKGGVWRVYAELCEARHGMTGNAPLKPDTNDAEARHLTT